MYLNLIVSVCKGNMFNSEQHLFVAIADISMHTSYQ